MERNRGRYKGGGNEKRSNLTGEIFITFSVALFAHLPVPIRSIHQRFYRVVFDLSPGERFAHYVRAGPARG
jgi:hypothetical protein